MLLWVAAPLIWPLPMIRTLCRLPIKDAEITVKLLPSQKKEATLRYRNGAEAMFTTCPLAFDRGGDWSRRYYKMGFGWSGGSMSLVAAGATIGTTDADVLVPSQHVVILRSQAEADEIDKSSPIPAGWVTRGTGDIGPVPQAFDAAKEEFQRAARQVEKLQAGRTLNDVSDAWKAYLEAFVQVRNKIIAGADSVAANEHAAKTWYGLLQDRIRKSELLRYLVHARNAQNHGVAAILGNDVGNLHVWREGVTHLGNLVITKRGIAVEFTGTPPSIAIMPNEVIAVPVVDSGEVFNPPEDGIGLLQLAQGGLMFMEEWLEGAALAFGSKKQ